MAPARCQSVRSDMAELRQEAQKSRPLRPQKSLRLVWLRCRETSPQIEEWRVGQDLIAIEAGSLENMKSASAGVRQGLSHQPALADTCLAGDEKRALSLIEQVRDASSSRSRPTMSGATSGRSSNMWQEPPG